MHRENAYNTQKCQRNGFRDSGKVDYDVVGSRFQDEMAGQEAAFEVGCIEGQLLDRQIRYAIRGTENWPRVIVACVEDQLIRGSKGDGEGMLPRGPQIQAAIDLP